MSLFLGILVLSGLGYLTLRQQRTIDRLRAENGKLRADTNELTTLRAAAKEAGRLRGQESEIQLLREENKDVLRLRNEVHQLREQQKETDALRAANARLLQAVQGGNLSSNQQAMITSTRREGAAIGISVRSVNDPQNPQAAPAPYNGTIVTGIDPNSPVAASGLKVGDVIVRADGRPIENPGQLQAEMLGRKPGDIVMLDVMREGAMLRIPVKTRDWPQ